MLDWFVEPDIANSAITEMVIETNPNLISNACMKILVDFKSIRQMFDEAACQGNLFNEQKMRQRGSKFEYLYCTWVNGEPNDASL